MVAAVEAELLPEASNVLTPVLRYCTFMDEYLYMSTGTSESIPSAVNIAQVSRSTIQCRLK
jgi:hypothetical protein